jgi:DNA polymerase/3'-5' exonuclease PolX
MAARRRPRGDAGAAGRAGPPHERTVDRLATIIGHGGRGRALARELAREGVRGRAGLRRPAVLARLPRAAQANVIYSFARRVPLAEARAVAAEVRRRLVFNLGGRRRRFEVVPVGSVRRRAATVRDIDFLVVVPPDCEAEFEHVLAAAALRPPRRADAVTFAAAYAVGSRRRSFVLRARGRSYRSDFFVTTAAEKPYALYHFTGPPQFNIRTRAHVKRRGQLLNQYGLFDAAARRRVRGSAAVRSERDLARFIGVTYHFPWARE